MLLKMRYYGDPILRKKCSPVSEVTQEIVQLVNDMIESMKEYNGIGLAAPQIGYSLRLFITQIPVKDESGEWVDGDIKVYINPEILEYTAELTILSEGCLSIPTIHAEVARPSRVTIKALDLQGTPFTSTVTDLEAHCVMHENDHINGVLFIDRIHGKERQLLKHRLNKVKEEFYKP